MILIWRGWGLLGVVAVFPALASCAGLVDLDEKWPILLALPTSLVIGGAVCIYFGMRWNQNAYEHTLFFVPLEVWGWVYLVFPALIALGAVAGAIRQGLDKLPFLIQAVVGVFGFLAVVGTGYLLIRVAAKRSHVAAPEDDRDFDLPDMPDLFEDLRSVPARQPKVDRPITDYSRLPKFGE